MAIASVAVSAVAFSTSKQRRHRVGDDDLARTLLRGTEFSDSEPESETIVRKVPVESA
jgi:hypothetical protein